MKPPFNRLLLQWNEQQNTRQMPWKGEKNPYFIWLSEVILQQTRVEQGLPYYVRFRQKFPTIKKLADAPEDEVMKLWQGLGYYSRARNLHFTAKHVAYNLKGQFPKSFEELKKLKGVGDYTAAAIASFAFNEKRAVVDGNVVRVLARVFGIDTPYDTTAGKKEFAQLAQQMIDDKQPGPYNQAIMDFGATVCLPQSPKCAECVFSGICIAYRQNLVKMLPVSEKRVKIRERFFNYLLIKNDKEILIEKRDLTDIWKNLYQLPLIETDNKLKRNFHPIVSKFLGTDNFEIKGYSTEEVQMLTHRKIHFRFIEVEVKDIKALKIKGLQRVKLKALAELAFPRTIHLYLRQNSLL